MAVRGTIRCDIETTLSEDAVTRIFEETLRKRSLMVKLVAKPSIWKIVPPPPGASSAAEWIRDKRQQRMLEMGKGENLIGAYGTIIALEVNPAQSGRTAAQIFTSKLIFLENGKVQGPGAIRNQMKRVAAAVTEADPKANVSHHEDDE